MLVALSGCGGSGKPCLYKGIKCENLPQHKVLHVNWNERASLDGNPLATFRVRTIEVKPRGWTITASFTNTSPRTFTFPRGGARSPRVFGLGVFVSALPQRIENAGNYLLKAQTVTPKFP